MDSDRDASSGNESDSKSNSKGRASPYSGRSSRNTYSGSHLSRSRSNSGQRSISPRSPKNGPRSPRTPASGPQSPTSEPLSPDSPRSLPRTPKTPDSTSRSPVSRNHSGGPHSPSPVNSSRSNSIKDRSMSPKSRSNSPKSRSSSSKSRSASPKSRSSSPKSRSNSPKSRSNSPKSRSSSADSSSSSKSRSESPNPPQLNGRSSKKYDSPKGSPRTGTYANNSDRRSAKSDSSKSSKKSSPDRMSVNSDKSISSRGSRSARKIANLDDGNTSDSSESSIDSSSRKNKNGGRPQDTQPEEISDGDMESENDKDLVTTKRETVDININHDDLSDVSDLDDSIGCHSEDEIEQQIKEKEKEIEKGKEEKPKVEEAKIETEVKKVADKTNRPEDGEEQLDFEAEDGECGDTDVTKDNKDGKEDKDEGQRKTETTLSSELKKEEKIEELEEGEVTDEDEVRPEETEPRPVCRFFSRGQCTWGASCRFLHPGVTDKGNYTMFELIRPVVPGEYGREERMYRPEPPMIESAWERGLRTAKEMLRKSIKRKEQDLDFEEKKMNLSLAQEEFDKENGYYARVPSPEPRFVMRHPVPPEYPPMVRPGVAPPPEEYFGRRQVLYEPEYVSPRERVRPTYRELPPHRMPDYYSSKYEEEQAQSTSKVRRPKREVIVQKVPEERQPGRGDEWSDPWMRSKSPGTRKGRKRSYSSGSSYSSSSSSRSSSASTRSSYSSRSRTSRHRREPRGGGSHRSRQAISPSVIVSERKAANERAALMNPPAPRKKAPSPGMMRAGAQNPPAPSKVDTLGRTRSKLAIAAALARVKGRRRSSRSSSDSSGSSSSDSDSSGSSSSSSRDGSPPPRRTAGVDFAMALKAKAIDALKGGTEKKQIKLNLKNPVGVRKPDIPDVRKSEAGAATQVTKKRPASSPPPVDPKNASNKKATSRREELLKQLKAVEDAIAKKRSKVN